MSVLPTLSERLRFKSIFAGLVSGLLLFGLLLVLPPMPGVCQELPPLDAPPAIAPNPPVRRISPEMSPETFDATVSTSDGASSASADPAVRRLEEILRRPVTNMSLPRGALVVPPAYIAYLNKVNAMSEGLLTLKDRFDKQMAVLGDNGTPPQLVLSLQELGAMTQKLSADNRRFKSQSEYGEDDYQSYQFIEQAVTSLEDAITYWRLSNRYRSLYRAEAREKIEDDELLSIKLQSALNAIESLKNIQLMRERLKKLDADTYP